jgi:hypothetical protein
MRLKHVLGQTQADDAKERLINAFGCAEIAA